MIQLFFIIIKYFLDKVMNKVNIFYIKKLL